MNKLMLKLNGGTPVSRLDLLGARRAKPGRRRNGSSRRLQPTLLPVTGNELDLNTAQNILKSHYALFQTLLVFHDQAGRPLSDREIADKKIEETLQTTAAAKGLIGTFLGSKVVVVSIEPGLRADQGCVSQAAQALIGGKIVIVAGNGSAPVSAPDLGLLLASELKLLGLTQK